MNKIIKMEYEAPETTILILSENSMICASPNGTSVESFTEDSELVW